MSPWHITALFISFLAMIVVVLFVLVIVPPAPAPPAPMAYAPQIRSLAEHVYAEDDMPFFNESVPEYRARMTRTLPMIRPGTIFISIASFRDDLCQETVLHAFARATHPSRVFIGVVDQIRLAGTDDDNHEDAPDIPCESLLPASVHSQVRIVRLAASNSRGPTHARYIGSKLWDGEAVFMQIDAHAKFLQGWDDLLLENLGAMPRPYRTMLSHYPAGAVEELGDHVRQWNCMATTEYAPPGLLYQVPDWCRPENMADGVALDAQGRPTTCYSPFVGAGFMAGYAAWVHDVPFDRYLQFLFHGEEILIAARLWTSGWDLFTPRLNLVTHVYGERKHSVFAEQDWARQGRLAEARARIILESYVAADAEVNDEIDRTEIEDLGMGMQRPLADYLEYAGIRFGTPANPNVTQTSRCSMRYDGRTWIHVETKDPVAI